MVAKFAFQKRAFVVFSAVVSIVISFSSVVFNRKYCAAAAATYVRRPTAQRVATGIEPAPARPVRQSAQVPLTLSLQTFKSKTVGRWASTRATRQADCLGLLCLPGSRQTAAERKRTPGMASARPQSGPSVRSRCGTTRTPDGNRVFLHNPVATCLTVT